jgi:hypothetical protein
MAFVGPGSSNVFVPSYPGDRAAGEMRVEYARNRDSFAVNNYARTVQVDKTVGKYLNIDNSDSTRVVNLQDSIWPDGTDRPRGSTIDHEFKPYETVRYAEAFTIGSLTVDQADWNIVASHARSKSQLAMTRRSLLASTLITTQAAWPAANTDTLGNLVTSGNWATSTEANGYIQKGIQAVAEQITLATGGVIRPNNRDIMCVIDPVTARLMAATEEIRTYVKNYPVAFDFMTQRDQTMFATYGLPAYLWGVRMMVEDCVRTSTRKGSGTQTKGFTPLSTHAVFLSNNGPQVQNDIEAPSMATLTQITQEDMTIELKDDTDNRRVQGSVVDNLVYELTAPLSGFFLRTVRS